ncbi:MAG TPA: hypothetical protein VN030_08845 [Cellvibrio sp.]|nr:hypothetical protein [Cellvibrio sp.]
MAKTIDVGLNLQLQGVKGEDNVPNLFAYAFDVNGTFIARQALEKNAGKIAFPAGLNGKTVRVLIAPAVEEKLPVFADLTRLGAYETRFNLRDGQRALNLILSPAQWRPLLWCICHIAGKLVKSVRLPDGSIKYLPICHARVTICEIDRLPILIEKLPNDLLWRLRDELLVAPEFPPEPPEEIIGPLGPLQPVLVSSVLRTTAANRVVAPAISRVVAKEGGDHSCESCKKTAVQQQTLSTRVPVASEFDLSVLKPLASVASVAHLRSSLVELLPHWIYRLCLFDWLEPFFIYHKHCFRTVMTDDSGRFSTLLFYPCTDQPDLYFSAEQWQGSAWHSIYCPSIRCGTHWNYQCGTELTLVVTDPAAIPCSPQDPVTPPEGLGTWVMPYMVGGTPIFGNPSMGAAPLGWVKPSGYTDYGAGSLGILYDAPFAATLGFRLGYSYDIPSAAVKYYRFSYRKVGAPGWLQMSVPVVRHYVHEEPGHLPTFPVYKLGPNTLGLQGNLFEFKPDFPPAPAATDPAGTVTYWPEDDWFGDIYSAFLDTATLPGGVAAAAGQYEVKVELFNAAGVQVSVGAAVNFIVPKTVDSSGVTARAAEVGEISANAFVFNLQIDNNPSTAVIEAPAISASAVTDVCGFLRYNNANDPVTLAFHANHPTNQAVFNFAVIRGAVAVPAASVAGYPEVSVAPVAVQDAVAAHAYSGDGAGNYAQTYTAATLLDSCENAAYALSLSVYGKATSGWGRVGYDAGTLRAFALAKS